MPFPCAADARFFEHHLVMTKIERAAEQLFHRPHDARVVDERVIEVASAFRVEPELALTAGGILHHADAPALAIGATDFFQELNFLRVEHPRHDHESLALVLLQLSVVELMVVHDSSLHSSCSWAAATL